MNRLLVVLSLACIACSVTIANANPLSIPSIPSVANASAINTAAPAPLIVVPTPEHVTTLGKLNIRELPDTSSQVIGWYEMGAKVVAIAIVSGRGCPNWYMVTYRGERGYICAEWCSK